MMKLDKSSSPLNCACSRVPMAVALALLAAVFATPATSATIPVDIGSSVVLAGSTTSSSGLDRPMGCDVTSSGDLYIANADGGTIQRIAAGTTTTVLLGNVATAQDLVIDTAGVHLYAVAWGGQIHTADLSQPAPSLTMLADVASTATELGGIDIMHSSGLLYFCTRVGSAVYKIQTDGSNLVQSGSNTQFARSLSIQQSSDLVYVTSRDQRVLYKVGGDGTGVTIVAGQFGSSGSDDGVGLAAKFVLPFGVTVSRDELYAFVCDSFKLRRVDLATNEVRTVLNSAGSAGSVTGSSVSYLAAFTETGGSCFTRSGSELYVLCQHAVQRVVYNGAADDSSVAVGLHRATFMAGTRSGGSSDGSGSSAQFDNPQACAVLADGTVLVSEVQAGRFRRLNPTNQAVSTVLSVGDLPAALGIALQSTGAIIVAQNSPDPGRACLRTLTLSGTPSTSAFSGDCNNAGFQDGASPLFRVFEYITVDQERDEVYAVDSGNHRLRVVSADGSSASTFFGTGGTTTTATTTNHPRGIAFRRRDRRAFFNQVPVGQIFIRTATSVGNDGANLVGNGASGYVDGVGDQAQVEPEAMILLPRDDTQILTVAEAAVRLLDVTLASISTLAGSATSSAWSGGSGSPSLAYYGPLHGNCIDTKSEKLYVVGEHAVAELDVVPVNPLPLNPQIVVKPSLVTIAGTGSVGSADATVSTDATFSYPNGVAIDANGDIIVADTESHKLRRIGRWTGVVDSIAGAGTTPSNANTADGSCATATFNFPFGVFTDSDSGSLYVADLASNMVRQIDSPTEGTCSVQTLAGNGAPGERVDGSPDGTTLITPSACTPEFKPTCNPCSWIGLAPGYTSQNFLWGGGGRMLYHFNPRHNKVVQNTYFPYSFYTTWGPENNYVTLPEMIQGDSRQIFDIRVSTSGFVSYWEGNPTRVFGHRTSFEDKFTGNIEGGPRATRCTHPAERYTGQAQLAAPAGIIRLRGAGPLLVTEKYSHAIRQLDLSGARAVSTVAGGSSAVPGLQDDPDPLNALFRSPFGLLELDDGSILVADEFNNCIRRLAPGTRATTTYAGDGTLGAVDDPHPPNATFGRPKALAADSMGLIYVTDYLNHRIRRISPIDGVTTVAGTGTKGSADHEVAVLATLFYPSGIAYHKATDSLIITDQLSQKVRALLLPRDNVVEKLTIGGSTTLDAADRRLDVKVNGGPGTTVAVTCSGTKPSIGLTLNVSDGAAVVVHDCTFVYEPAIVIRRLGHQSSLTFLRNVINGSFIVRQIDSAAGIEITRNSFAQASPSSGFGGISLFDPDAIAPTYASLGALTISQNHFHEVGARLGKVSNAHGVAVRNNSFTGPRTAVHAIAVTNVFLFTVQDNSWSGCTGGDFIALHLSHIADAGIVTIADNAWDCSGAGTNPGATAAMAVGELARVLRFTMHGQNRVRFTNVDHCEAISFHAVKNVSFFSAESLFVDVSGTSTSTAHPQAALHFGSIAGTRSFVVADSVLNTTIRARYQTAVNLGQLVESRVILSNVSIHAIAWTASDAVALRLSTTDDVTEPSEVIIDQSVLWASGKNKPKAIRMHGSRLQLTLQRSGIYGLSNEQGGHGVFVDTHLTMNDELRMYLWNNVFEYTCKSHHGLVMAAALMVDTYNAGETVRNSVFHVASNRVRIHNLRSRVWKMASTEENVTSVFLDNAVEFASTSSGTLELYDGDTVGSGNRSLTVRCNTVDGALDNDFGVNAITYPHFVVLPCGACSLSVDCNTERANRTAAIIGSPCGCGCIDSTMDPSAMAPPLQCVDWFVEPFRPRTVTQPITISRSVSQTRSMPTVTGSLTVTASPSTTRTRSVTASVSMSGSRSVSGNTDSGTTTQTKSLSFSRSLTASTSSTLTFSRTASESKSLTSSQTLTASRTLTGATLTWTPSPEPTATHPPTSTPTLPPTMTVTLTLTISAGSPTPTHPLTPTATVSMTRSRSLSQATESPPQTSWTTSAEISHSLTIKASPSISDDDGESPTLSLSISGQTPSAALTESAGNWSRSGTQPSWTRSDNVSSETVSQTLFVAFPHVVMEHEDPASTVQQLHRTVISFALKVRAVYLGAAAAGAADLNSTFTAARTTDGVPVLDTREAALQLGPVHGVPQYWHTVPADSVDVPEPPVTPAPPAPTLPLPTSPLPANLTAARRTLLQAVTAAPVVCAPSCVVERVVPAAARLAADVVGCTPDVLRLSFRPATGDVPARGRAPPRGEVTLSRRCLAHQPSTSEGDVTVRFEIIEDRAPPPELPAAQAEAAEASATAASTAAAVTGSPVTAAQVSRVGAIASLAACEGTLEDDIDATSSPVTWFAPVVAEPPAPLPTMDDDGNLQDDTGGDGGDDDDAELAETAAMHVNSVVNNFVFLTMCAAAHAVLAAFVYATGADSLTSTARDVARARRRFTCARRRFLREAAAQGRRVHPAELAVRDLAESDDETAEQRLERRERREELLLAEPDSKEAVSVRRHHQLWLEGRTRRDRLFASCALVRFPGLQIVPLLMVLQQVATGGLAGMLHADVIGPSQAAAARFIGVLGLGFCIVVCAAVGWAVTVGRAARFKVAGKQKSFDELLISGARKEIANRASGRGGGAASTAHSDDDPVAARVAEVRAAALRRRQLAELAAFERDAATGPPPSKLRRVGDFLLGIGKWATLPAMLRRGVPVHRLYGLLMIDYRSSAPWFMLGELVVSVVIGMLAAIAPTTIAGCRAVAISMAGVFAAYTGALVVLWPFAVPFTTVVAVPVGVGQTLGTVAMAAYLYYGDERAWLADVGLWLPMVCVYVMLAKQGVDLVLLFIEGITRLRGGTVKNRPGRGKKAKMAAAAAATAVSGATAAVARRRQLQKQRLAKKKKALKSNDDEGSSLDQPLLRPAAKSDRGQAGFGGSSSSGSDEDHGDEHHKKNPDVDENGEEAILLMPYDDDNAEALELEEIIDDFVLLPKARDDPPSTLERHEAAASASSGRQQLGRRGARGTPAPETRASPTPRATNANNPSSPAAAANEATPMLLLPDMDFLGGGGATLPPPPQQQPPVPPALLQQQQQQQYRHHRGSFAGAATLANHQDYVWAEDPSASAAAMAATAAGVGGAGYNDAAWAAASPPPPVPLMAPMPHGGTMVATYSHPAAATAAAAEFDDAVPLSPSGMAPLQHPGQQLHQPDMMAMGHYYQQQQLYDAPLTVGDLQGGAPPPQPPLAAHAPSTMGGSVPALISTVPPQQHQGHMMMGGHPPLQQQQQMPLLLAAGGDEFNEEWWDDL